MKKYRRFLLILLILDLVVLGVLSFREVKKRLPESLWFIAGQEETYNLKLPLPLVVETEEIAVSAEVGEYEASVRLFGIVPVGTMKIGVMESTTLLACGTPVGVYLETSGVLVLGTGSFSKSGGGVACPAENILRSGDYIVEINEKEVLDKEDVVAAIQKSEGEQILVTVRRNAAFTTLRIVPEKGSEGDYLIGVWIRDDTAGIGTLTYINPATMEYGALGHAITDGDTGDVFSISEGTVYAASIVSVVKGEKGKPGELVGTMTRSAATQIGSIAVNNGYGIFGDLSEPSLDTFMSRYGLDESYLYEIGLKQEVEEGKAFILCSVSGLVEAYEIRIEEITLGAKNNKGISILVTDERLIEKTGGIVQGMSGAPIIQNGKIIGAVTHVLVRDPLRGYGTFIETMLEDQR